MNENRQRDLPIVTVLWMPGAGVVAAGRLNQLVSICPGTVVALGPDPAMPDSYRPEAGVLDRIVADHPDRDVLLLRADLDLPPGFFERLDGLRPLLSPDTAVVLAGNYDSRVDPLAGLETGDLDLDAATWWAGDRCAQLIDSPPSDCLLIAAGAASGEPASPRISRALLVDEMYVRDSSRPASADRICEDGGAESEPPLGHLRMRIESLVEEGAPALPPPSDRPVTLHIAHSWGGGIWRWIEDFAAGDPARVHLVLIAVSDGPGRTCGRYLRLCAAGAGRGVIREFALSPMIEAVADRNELYAAHLGAVIERFGVARIAVSSLIGHTLDCLRTGIPTLAMLHDFFPLWPLLDRDPQPFLHRAEGDPDQARSVALAEQPSSMQFGPKEPDFWNRIAGAWLEAASADDVALCAPTNHVIERFRALADRVDLKISRVPHGFRAFESPNESEPPPAGTQLHLLIPGRLSAGKGLRLLREALPRLVGKMRLTAVGCGREGLALMGQPGIDLVPEYRREELPGLVAALRPHAALLLSTVPETWSYTLSEVRALGLAPVATRVGSFAERIEHDHDGVLFQPDPDSLVDCLLALAEAPERLASLAAEAAPERSLEAMATELDRICPGRTGEAAGIPRPKPMTATETTWALQAARLATARADVREARAELSQMREDLETRSRWAETMERQFRRRSEWAKRLDAQVAEQGEALVRQDRQYHELSDRYSELLDRYDALDRNHAQLREQQAALIQQHDHLLEQHDQLQKQHEYLCRLHEKLGQQYEQLGRQHDALAGQHDALGRQHDALGRQHEQLQSEYDAMVGSTSWKLTRPLRFVRRVVTRRRLRKLVNPLQWIRMTRVFIFYWRYRGFRGALDALQHPQLEEAQAEVFTDEQLLRPASVVDPVTLEPVDDPEVSIIIPVYNQLAYTAACLESIASIPTNVGYEVLVVDDASSDDTQAWLKRCRGIRVLRNRLNKGFIGTCNRGAKHARGRYLVFLNNDTRVTDGWLDALVDTFRAHPGAGVVGARLVFADGTLQEAGGIVFRDATGWNFGRGDDPDRPVYRFVSEADYVSGACLAIERERFAELGAFDKYYAPAYYEDTDLCFKARQAGLKVLYQPASTVIHFEGATSGTDETSGAKRYQVVNREKFLERWADTLAAHPENPGEFTPSAARAFRFRRFPRRALVIDAVTPMPDHDSGSVRMFAMLRLLGELGYRTSFMPQNLAWTGRHSEDLQQAGVEVLTAPWLANPEEWLAGHGSGLDLVIVSRHYVLTPLMKMLRKRCREASVVFDTVDLHFLREQREAELAGTAAAARIAETTRTEELALIDQADATLVVSEFERELLADLVPDAPVIVVSNIHSLHPRGKPFEQRDGLVFVGGFQHPPNLDAAEWLIEEILPLIRRELPDVTLHLIGSKMPDRLKQRKAPGLRVHGFVSDLEPFMNGCRISLAPLRYGAGVKGKVNQAMSHGLPVVATSCAAEGMYTEHEHDILVADDGVAFAAEVCRLYRDGDLWQRLAENGRINVDRHFSLDAARRSLESLLSELGRRDRR